MLRIVCRRIASRGNALLSSKNFRFLSSNAESSGDSLPLGENEKNSSAIPMPGSEKLAVELPKSIFEIIEKTEIIEEKVGIAMAYFFLQDACNRSSFLY